VTPALGSSRSRKGATISLGERGVRGIVLDIEGTTTPISFVYEVLFPYARKHLREYLHANRGSDALDRAIKLLHEEWPPDLKTRAEGMDAFPVPPGADSDSLAGYLERLMDRDVKSPGLKVIQGEIWKIGYDEGALRGEVFPDVPGALERWRTAEIDVAIYSSGSVLAQRLIFGTTPYGDLTRFVGHFFDTGVGKKLEGDSYRRIAQKMGQAPAKLIFISDIAAELAAARDGDIQPVLCIRPGNAPQESAEVPIRTFDEVQL
jgi:2,3-diketo-5-methylthio-1-phosphopentane phosphatase